MKRILFLAPYSIPVNNPEAICNAKVLKILSEAGYVIDVISKNNLSAYAPSGIDNIFTHKLNSVRIFSISNRICLRSIIDHFLILCKTGYVYKGAHWAIYAINYAEKLICKNEYDWIMSRSPSSEIAALYLSQKYHIKWIANWNDPYPEKCMPFPYGGGINVHLSYFQRKLLKEVALKADWHTFPTVRLRDYMLQYMPINIKRTLIIPHAIINNLFESGVDKKEPVGNLILVHSGNVSFPRDPYPFLQGVQLFFEQRKNAAMEVWFVGKQSDQFNYLIHKMHLDKVIKVLPPLSYLDNLRLIEQCDIAVLIEAPSENSIFLPTKVVDYMQCNKPILAVSPQNGVLHDLYEKKVVEYFADCTSPQSISLELMKIFDQYECVVNLNGKICPDFTDTSILNIYSQVLDS